jgi:hypothetical protein
MTAKAETDEYLAACEGALNAARSLTHGRGTFRTADGTVLWVSFRIPVPVRIMFRLVVDRTLPGQQQATRFLFQRNGRVALSGDRRVPLREKPWATRDEVLELATQLEDAKEWRDAWRDA